MMIDQRKKKILFILLGCGVAGLILAAGVFMYLNSSPLADGEEFLFEIQRGAGFYQVAEELSRKGAIRSLRFFKQLGKMRNVSHRIKAGYYTIDSSMTANQLIDLFVAGRVYTVRITIPEGLHNRQLAERLYRHELIADIESFIKTASDGSLLARAGLPAQSTTEGFLFPDTYHIPWGSSEEDIILMMVRNFRNQVGEAMLQQMKESSIGFYNTVIMASIVERESRLPAEFPKVAGVFYNRLRVNMKFESCATIQYILGEVREVLNRGEIFIDDPYNTYQNAGFPPGPICNPGLSAIRAAVQPAQHDYLFFVSRNDGSHHFSRTGAEHNRAAHRYQWSRQGN